MTRESKADFNVLRNYIDNYSLREISDETFLRQLSSMHRNLLALLIICNRASSYLKTSGNLPASQYLNELTSECIGVLFNWIHGNYKSSKVILRSTIEVFSKFVILFYDSEIPDTKRVYEVFEKAESVIHNDTISASYREILSSYSELCKFVHTASEEQMQLTNGLDFYPNRDANKAEDIKKEFSEILNKYIFILSLQLKPLYLTLHHRDIDSLNSCLRKEQISVLRSPEGL